MLASSSSKVFHLGALRCCDSILGKQIDFPLFILKINLIKQKLMAVCLLSCQSKLHLSILELKYRISKMLTFVNRPNRLGVRTSRLGCIQFMSCQ